MHFPAQFLPPFPTGLSVSNKVIAKVGRVRYVSTKGPKIYQLTQQRRPNLSDSKSLCNRPQVQFIAIGGNQP